MRNLHICIAYMYLYVFACICMYLPFMNFVFVYRYFLNNVRQAKNSNNTDNNIKKTQPLRYKILKFESL